MAVPPAAPQSLHVTSGDDSAPGMWGQGEVILDRAPETVPECVTSEKPRPSVLCEQRGQQARRAPGVAGSGQAEPRPGPARGAPAPSPSPAAPGSPLASLCPWQPHLPPVALPMGPSCPQVCMAGPAWDRDSCGPEERSEPSVGTEGLLQPSNLSHSPREWPWAGGRGERGGGIPPRWSAPVGALPWAGALLTSMPATPPLYPRRGAQLGPHCAFQPGPRRTH